jgi:hypothetical protein
MKNLARTFCVISVILLVPVLIHSSVHFSRIAVSGNFVTVSLSSDSTNNVNIARVLDDGLDLKVIYAFSLYKRGAFMIPDELISANELVIDARKDLINYGYEAEIHFKGDTRGRWFPTAGELTAFLMRLDYFRLQKLSGLNQDEVYFFEVRQEITSLDIVPPLSFIYSLFGSWNYVSQKTRSNYFTRNGILHD